MFGGGFAGDESDPWLGLPKKLLISGGMVFDSN